MKKLNFETIKGKFVVVDEKEFTVFNQCTVEDKWIVDGEIYDYNSHSFLKELTEQQASEIVEDKYNQYNYGQYNPTAIHRLHSLITSSGYYLFENPNKDPGLIPSSELDVYRKAQDKTFFNPIIFKLV